MHFGAVFAEMFIALRDVSMRSGGVGGRSAGASAGLGRERRVNRDESRFMRDGGKKEREKREETWRECSTGSWVQMKASLCPANMAIWDVCVQVHLFSDALLLQDLQV